MEVFYKLAYDISCYYAFVSFFLSYSAGLNTHPYSFMIFFTASFLVAYADQVKNSAKVVKICAMVLPVLSLLCETTVWGRATLVIPWVYFLLTVIREGYDITYNRFRKTYLVFFWVFAAVFGFFVAEKPIKGEVALIVAIPYIVILLAAGVFLLQMLRYQTGSKDKKRLEKYQRKQLIIFLTISVLLTVGNVMEWLYTHVLYPLSQLLFAGLVSLLYALLKPLTEHRGGINTAPLMEDWKEYVEKATEIQSKGEAEGNPIRQMMSQVEVKEMDWTYVYIGIGVLAAIVLLAVLIGGKRRTKKAPAIEDEREEFYEEIPEAEVLKKHSPRPDIVIRYYYREFMKKSETKNQKLEVADTTKDILRKFRKQKKVLPEDSAEAEELTQLYRKTRYSKAEVTHADANRMKNLVKGI